MKRISVFAVIFTFLFSALPLFSQIGSSSAITDRYGSMFTYSAKTLKFPQYYFYQNNKLFIGTANRGIGSSTKVKDYGAQLGLNFGFTESFDVIISGNFVQTPNRAPNIPKNKIVGFFNSVDVPDEFYLNLRYIPWVWKDGQYRLGFMLTRKFNGNGFPNAPFQVYQTESPDVGLSLIGSYFAMPGIEDNGLMAHINLQYWNHLDAGKYIAHNDEDDVRDAVNSGGKSLADTSVVGSNTSSIRFSLGAQYPLFLGGRYLFLTGDIYGLFYLQKPPVAAYSRQNYAYLALGAKYQAFNWMAVHVGADFRVLSGSDKTISSDLLEINDLTIGKSDYPTWHFYAGVTVPLEPRVRVVRANDESELYARQSKIKKNEVKDILYSEQEIQKRSQNFIPLKEMRRSYKSIIGNLLGVLEPKDKKPVEPEPPADEQSTEGQN